MVLASLTGMVVSGLMISGIQLSNRLLGNLMLIDIAVNHGLGKHVWLIASGPEIIPEIVYLLRVSFSLTKRRPARTEENGLSFVLTDIMIDPLYLSNLLLHLDIAYRSQHHSLLSTPFPTPDLPPLYEGDSLYRRRNVDLFHVHDDN